MSQSHAFVFPKQTSNSFQLIHGSTIGYISDSIFYTIDLISGVSNARYHPQGRSYQAFTANHKRGITVLADYGKSSNISFEFEQKEKSFRINDACPLEINFLQLSLDGKYLAVACGSPTFKIIIINVEERRVISSSQSFINLKGKSNKLKQIAFNPANRKIIALLFQKSIEIYELKDSLEINTEGSIENGFIVRKKFEIETTEKDQFFECLIWDQINNLYISNGSRLFLFSTDTGRQVCSYDIEIDADEKQVVRSLFLTLKHIIVFYSNGKIQWLLKYYPELLEEDSLIKPFQVDKYYETNQVIIHATYDHLFQNLLLANKNGYFNVIPIIAESNVAEEEEDENQQKAKKNEKQKKLDLQPKQIGPYHTSSIILIRQIEKSSLCLTVSTDGRIILWSTRQKRQLVHYDTGSQLCSADINKNCSVLALGLTNGILQFYSIANTQNTFLFKELRMTHGHRLDKMLFSSSSDELAVLSKSQNRIYYILTNLSLPFEILGYVTLPYTPLNIVWNNTQKTPQKPKFQYLLVSIGFGILMINSPTPSPSKKRGPELDLQLQIYAIRTDPEQYEMFVLNSGEIITSGDDKMFKKYKQPEELLAKVDYKSKAAIPPPIEEIEAHDLKISCIDSRNTVIISGGVDGSVQIRDSSNFNQVKSYKAHGWKKQSLISVGSSSINGIFFTGGIDGCFQIWRINEAEATGNDSVNIEQPAFKRIESNKNLKYFELMIEEQYLQRMKEVINNKKKVQFEKLAKIKRQLNDLLVENQKHDEMQKLNRDQFAIDLQSRQIVAKAGRQNCLKIREESKRKIIINQVYAKKLKQITWDRMDIHLKAINGLKNNFIVYNYQLRKISREQKRKLKLIIDLRKAQRRQAKKRTQAEIIDPEFYKNKNVVNGGVVQPLILTAPQKKQEKKEQKGGKKKKEDEGAAEKVEVAEQIFNEDQWNLLYSAFQLYSDNAKKNQIVMMSGLIIRIKETFNKEFEKLLKYRQNQNQMINDKNKRITEITEELKRPNEVLIGKKNYYQSSDQILEVHPNQISFKRYLSRQQRQKLQKQRLKQEERMRKLAQDDASQRALQKMMGGTLEEKKTSVLEMTVEREKWMDKPVEDMSQQEKAKMKEYEQKRIKAEEEKERIVKKLEAELRKLKLEIDDIMEKYDEKLFNLLRRKIEYDYRIEEQELYCTRLYLSITTTKEEAQKQKSLIDKIERSKKNLELLRNQHQNIQNYNQGLEKAKQAKRASLDQKKLGDNDSKIKTIEKTIFEDYSTNIKKRRQMEQKFLEHEPSYKYQLINLDPMRQIESKNFSSEKAKDFNFFISQIKILQQTYDIPQASLLQILEARFNIRRQEQELQTKLKILRETEAHFQQKLRKDEQSLSKDELQLEQIEGFLMKAKSNLDIQIRIKQGQVEINNDKPVPELFDALLISKDKIVDKNSNIMINANQKIAVMQQIKTCKISVTEQTLNLEKKEELINKLSAMIKEIQMLKVKKEMQVALAKKDTHINQNEFKSLKEQIEKVRKEGEKRIALFQKKIEKILHEIETIKKENKQLEGQKWNLEATVKQREKIRDMMCGENGQGNSEAKEKFQQIAINRQLFDRAKQQTEQIELLREQLSKLKAKTFANFSNAQR